MWTRWESFRSRWGVIQRQGRGWRLPHDAPNGRDDHDSNASQTRLLAMLLPLFGLALVTRVSATCYEPSFAHQPPEYDLDHPSLRDAFTHLHDVLTITLSDPKYNSTSVSVGVTSSKESLWEFHHTARERNASRPDIPQVNSDALYRIASITKAFTVLGLLKQHAAGNLSLDDTVDKYITELKGPQNGTIPWKDITLRSLASQLSGIPREREFSYQLPPIAC